jgi:hypothetical protein
LPLRSDIRGFTGKPCTQQPSNGRLSAKAAIPPCDGKQATTEPPLPSLAGVSEIACLYFYFLFRSSPMTIVKTSASYFACASSSTTAASLSRICFVPSS